MSFGSRSSTKSSDHLSDDDVLYQSAPVTAVRGKADVSTFVKQPVVKQSAAKQPILIVLHQATSTPGRVGQLLRQAGFDLDIRRPALGDHLPSTLAHHGGAVIFGGPMSANGDEDFIKYETDWLKIPLRENAPFLGICLGAQMLARHIGGRVTGDPAGEIEIGWYPIEATKEGKQLFDWPQMVYHFHTEGIYDLPRDTQLLARGHTYPNQAFRYGENAWAIQFHAELTQAMMHRWVVRAAHRFEDKGAQKGQTHLEGRLLHDRPLRSWLEQALTRIFDLPLNVESTCVSR